MGTKTAYIDSFGFYTYVSSRDCFVKVIIIIIIIIIIIMAGMAVFNVAGYLIEERRRWPVITASPRGQYSK